MEEKIMHRSHLFLYKLSL